MQERSPIHLLRISILLSVLLRLGSALYQGNTVVPLPATHDQVSYHTLATRVLGGHGFSFATGWWPATRAGEPTAHWSYLYTLYLAFLYFLFGTNPLIARVIQCLIAGIVQPWLCWRIGTRVCGKNTGIVAAFFTAVYGYFVYYAGALMTESFFILAVLWIMDISTQLAEDHHPDETSGRQIWVWLGIAAGIAVLLRQVFLLFVPFLLMWLAWVLRRQLRVAGPRILLFCAVMFSLILPWTVRNYFAFGMPVLLNTNAGYALFWANHPVHGRSFIPVIRENIYGNLIPPELRPLNEAALDRELLRRGLQFIVEDPQRYLSLCVGRASEYLRFWPSEHSEMAGNVIRTLSFGLLFPFMILGITLASLGRTFARKPHALFMGFAGVFTLVHLLSWSLIRYRLPVDGVLILYASAGAVWLANRVVGAHSWRFVFGFDAGE